jgi:hypothetical protein
MALIATRSPCSIPPEELARNAERYGQSLTDTIKPRRVAADHSDELWNDIRINRVEPLSL